MTKPTIPNTSDMSDTSDVASCSYSGQTVTVNTEDSYEKPEDSDYIMPSPAPLQPGQGLVIGDRDIHTKDISKLVVTPLLGACISRIRSHLEFNALKDRRYAFVIILGGTHDCEDYFKSYDQIIEDVMSMIQSALKLSNKVVLSSILPRVDNESALFKSAKINGRLSDICLFMPGVKFINNDLQFTNVDKSPRNDCFNDLDGFTLSQIGYELLVQNLGIEDLVLSNKCANVDRKEIFDPAPLPTNYNN